MSLKIFRTAEGRVILTVKRAVVNDEVLLAIINLAARMVTVDVDLLPVPCKEQTWINEVRFLECTFRQNMSHYLILDVAYRVDTITTSKCVNILSSVQQMTSLILASNNIKQLPDAVAAAGSQTTAESESEEMVLEIRTVC